MKIRQLQLKPIDIKCRYIDELCDVCCATKNHCIPCIDYLENQGYIV